MKVDQGTNNNKNNNNSAIAPLVIGSAPQFSQRQGQHIYHSLRVPHLSRRIMSTSTSMSMCYC